jgi:hypothetical protein
MPILVHVSTHLSFFSPAWMIIVTAVSVWLCWRVTHLPLPPILIPVVNAATFSTNQTVPTMLQASFSFGEILANIMIITLAFLCFLLFNHARLGLGYFWAKRQPLSLFLRIRQNQTEAPTMASEADEAKQGYKRRYRRR